MFVLLACADPSDTGDTSDTGLPSVDLGDAFAASTLEAHVQYLASEALAGRKAGSEGDLLGVQYIVDALDAAGFEPVHGAWEWPFVDSEGTDSVNVLGVRWGSDPDVGSEIVVIGSHHDHLGQRGSEIWPGANDDASGVAVMLGLAEAFGGGDAPDRTVVLASWGSEEVNIDGSRAYVDAPPAELPLADTVHYVNLDMVGTYDAYETLYALDAVHGSVARRVVNAAAADSPLVVDVRELGELSDSESFCDVGVPDVFFFTEDPDCYHEPCDTADRLDYDDLSAVGALVGQVVGSLTSATLDLATQRADGCPSG